MHQFFSLLIFMLPASDSNENITKINFMKPDFSQYCITKDSCLQDCQCTIAYDCEVLPMTVQLRGEVLNFLNHKRDIQSSKEPVPSGLSMLIYDHQLEELSRCWAGNCNSRYSECFRTERFPETSQTVGQIILEQELELSSDHWSRIIDNWYYEPSYFNAEFRKSLSEGSRDEKVHNFAQILSDSVLYVGCSWGVFVNTLTFVCTFGPKGPQQGEEIYKAGEVCSSCPEGYRCVLQKPFENLCKKFELEKTSGELSTTTMKNKRKGNESMVKSFFSHSKDTFHDPTKEEERDWDLLWWFGIEVVLLLLVTIIVISLFYIFKLNEL